jgi:hypothetical protein
MNDYPPDAEYAMDDVFQLPINDDHLYRDLEYSRDACMTFSKKGG